MLYALDWTRPELKNSQVYLAGLIDYLPERVVLYTRRPNCNYSHCNHDADGQVDQ